MLDTEIIEIAKNIYDTEIKSLELRMNKLSENFVKVVRKIYDCKGKVVVTGIGKTGIIGKKISATFASTGTTSIFMNSTEGLHGDLGIINQEDIVLAISNSGESDEILAIMPAIKNIGAYIIAMTGNINSRLAKASDLYINTHVEEEGCPINLAPMSSTTNALVMGDALAGCLMKLRNFSPQNFAMYHPGGSLGRKLLTRVGNLMKTGEALALCKADTSMEDIVILMSEKKLAKGNDKAALNRRLKRIEGQVKGIQKMIEDDRYCVDILVQISAIRSAIDNVGTIILENHIKGCVSNDLKYGDEEQSEAAIKELMATIKKFTK